MRRLLVLLACLTLGACAIGLPDRASPEQEAATAAG